MLGDGGSVEAAAADAAGQMAFDEALLEALPAGAAGLRFYNWARPAVTFGYSQPFAFALALARERGITDVVRRPTGGGVVFHDGDLTFSLVFPWDRLCSPALVYKNIHRGVHLGLKGVGIKTALKGGPAEGIAHPLEKACFSAEPEAMDVLNDRGEKVLGGALRRKAGKGLYQGSLRPEKLGRRVEELRPLIQNGLTLEFPQLTTEPPRGIADLAQSLLAKYTSDRWNRRR